MNAYDLRHFTDSVEARPVQLTDDDIDAMVAENPDLNADDVRLVADAINWRTLADPIGFVRVRPDREAIAVRVANKDHPWEVIWVNGRGGSVYVGEIRHWPPYEPTEVPAPTE